MKQTTSKSTQGGLTLVEIMISITISLILLAGVAQIFFGNQQTYRVQEASSRIQENGRFAMHFLTKEIRMAGFTGCASMANVTNIADVNNDDSADETGDFTTGGIDGREQAGLPIDITDTVALALADVNVGTDVLIIKRGTDTGVRLTGNMGTINANIQVSAAAVNGMFLANDILIISDCEQTDIFAANNVSNGAVTTTIAHSNAVNKGNNLSKLYDTSATIMKFENLTYYIANNIAGVPSLYRRRLATNAIVTEELVNGIEDMEILYGEDTDNDNTANRYVAADAAGLLMANVVSVRITLTLRTLADNVASVAANGDRRIRRTYTTTTAIRNRIL